MRRLADENIQRSVVLALRAAGHDVAWAVETGRRAADAEHMAVAARDDRVLLTEDTDFAKLAHDAGKQGSAAPAVILVRLHGMRGQTKIDRIVEAIAEADPATKPGLILVVEVNRTRRRLLRRDFA